MGEIIFDKIEERFEEKKEQGNKEVSPCIKLFE